MPLGSAATQDVARQSAAVVNGRPAGENELYGTVALLRALTTDDGPQSVSPRDLQSRVTCSGTLLAPTVVLTAAHCVDTCPSVTPDPGCSFGPAPADSLYVGAGFADIDDVWTAQVVGVDAILIFDEYVGPHVDPDEVRDVAILVVKEPITLVEPVPILPADRLDAVLQKEASVFVQGYGATQDESQRGELLREPEFRSLLNIAETRVARLGPMGVATSPTDSGGDACFGDSGGPLYVRDGETLFVVGVAALLLPGGQRICGAGAVYALAPNYTGWITENVPSLAFSRSTLSGGGGCSATISAPHEPTVVFGLLLLLVVVSSRRSNRSRFAQHPTSQIAIAATILLGSCGDDDNLSSFCTEDRDPSGVVCRNSSSQRLELSTALAKLEAAFPELRQTFLVSARSGGGGFMNPDGESFGWRVNYYVPGRVELPDGWLIQAQVGPGFADISNEGTTRLRCLPTEPLPALNSRKTTHAAIRNLEEEHGQVRVEPSSGLHLALDHPCIHGLPAGATALVSLRRSDGSSVYSFFDTEGAFLGLEGPCVGNPWDGCRPVTTAPPMPLMNKTKH